MTVEMEDHLKAWEEGAMLPDAVAAREAAARAAGERPQAVEPRPEAAPAAVAEPAVVDREGAQPAGAKRVSLAERMKAAKKARA